MKTAKAVRNDKRVPVLYLDLDGTVRKGKDELGRFVNKADDVELFPRMAERLLSWKQRGWRIVAVSNQGGIATGQVSFEDVAAAINRTYELSGGIFDLMYFCQHHPDAHDPEWQVCFCRKPKIGMLVMAATELGNRHHGELYPPHISLMVGDRDEDRLCAENAGVPFQWAKEWREEQFTIELTQDAH
jgi:D-glycero-D-manno-heptose 1,7-bisphosphate phosphatase